MFLFNFMNITEIEKRNYALKLRIIVASQFSELHQYLGTFNSDMTKLLIILAIVCLICMVLVNAQGNGNGNGNGGNGGGRPNQGAGRFHDGSDGFGDFFEQILG
ncbi:CLUMA_CG016216, isoform A [Clunio marinus]|uniref:CLUMA_CG016216, isoform A n=1 Tax=Clunio marinus TaxID=568069 RepID=A0A1J1ITP5_9DIPT|nr:CLUMA_CG016216, isoform A [Clunio marinus]